MSTEVGAIHATLTLVDDQYKTAMRQARQAGRETGQAIAQQVDDMQKAVAISMQSVAADMGKMSAAMAQAQRESQRAMQAVASDVRTSSQSAKQALKQASQASQESATFLVGSLRTITAATKKSMADVASSMRAASEATRGSVGQMDAVLKQGAAAFRAMRDESIAAARQAQRDIDATREHAQQAQQGWHALGMGLTAFGAAAEGALTLAARNYITFDGSVRNANTMAHLNEAQFAKLNEQVLSFAKDSGLTKGPRDLADALFNIYSSIPQSSQGLTILKEAAKGATAGLTSTNTASEVLTGTMNAFNLISDDVNVTMKNAKMVDDNLFMAVQNGVMTYEQLAQSVGNVTSTAAAAHISIQEMLGDLATLTLRGVKVDEAVTSLNGAILHLIAPGKQARDLMKELGIHIDANTIKQHGLNYALKELIDKTGGSVAALNVLIQDHRALKGVLALTSDGLALATKNVRDQERASKGLGATQQALIEEQKSLQYALQRSAVDIEVAGIKAGKVLAPYIREAAKWARDAASAFDGMSDHMRTMTTTMAAVTGGLSLMGGGFLLLAPQIKAAIELLVSFKNTAVGAKIATALFSDGLGAALIPVGLLAAAIIHATEAQEAWNQKMQLAIDRGEAYNAVLRKHRDLLIQIHNTGAVPDNVSAEETKVTMLAQINQRDEHQKNIDDLSPRLAALKAEQMPANLGAGAAAWSAQHEAQLRVLQAQMDNEIAIRNKLSGQIRSEQAAYGAAVVRDEAKRNVAREKADRLAAQQKAAQEHTRSGADAKVAALYAGKGRHGAKHLSAGELIARAAEGDLKAGKLFRPGQKEQCANYVRDVVFRATGLPLGSTKVPWDYSATHDARPGPALAESLFGSDMGRRIRTIAGLKRGDQIAYSGTYGGYNHQTITHAGVYVGNGMMISRPTMSGRVTKERVDPRYFYAGLRMGDPGAGGSSANAKSDIDTYLTGIANPFSRQIAEEKAKFEKVQQEVLSYGADHGWSTTKLDRELADVLRAHKENLAKIAADEQKADEDMARRHAEILGHANESDLQQHVQAIRSKERSDIASLQEMAHKSKTQATTLASDIAAVQKRADQDVETLKATTAQKTAEQLAAIEAQATNNRTAIAIAGVKKQTADALAQIDYLKQQAAADGASPTALAKYDRVSKAVEAHGQASENAVNYNSQMQQLAQLQQLGKITADEELQQAAQVRDAWKLEGDAKIQGDQRYASLFLAYLNRQKALLGTSYKQWLEAQKQALFGAAQTSTAAQVQEGVIDQQLLQERLARIMEWRQTYIQSIQNVGTQFGNFLQSMMDGSQKFGNAFTSLWKSVANDVIAEITRMIAKMVEMRVMEALLGIFTAGFNGFIGGAANAAKAASNDTAGLGMRGLIGKIGLPAVPGLHTGGVVVPGGVQKLHDGGFAGMGMYVPRPRSDEVLTMLQVGERVRTAGQERALQTAMGQAARMLAAGMGGTGRREQPPVNINVAVTGNHIASDVDVDRLGDVIGRRVMNQIQAIS